MPGKISFLILFCSLIISCAHPNYGETASLQDQIQSQNGACSFSFTGPVSCAQISWEKTQTDDEMGIFLLRFGSFNANKSFTPQDPFQILQVRLWMPSMGHGSSPLTLSKIDIGAYRVTGVWFSMPGNWEIQIKLQNQNGVVSESILPVRF